MNVEQLEPRCLLSGSAVRREIMPAATLAPATISPLVVNTLADETNPNDGLLSLREAIAQAQTSAQPITFDPSLAGGTITLSGSNGPIRIATATTISNSTTGAINIAAGTGAFLEVSSGGSLQLSNVSLTGANPVLQLDSGGAATLTDVPEAAPITNNGALTGSEDQAITWSGPIGGTGSLATSGTQALTLAGTNSYTGGTTIAAYQKLIGNTLALQGTISTGFNSTVGFDETTLSGAAGTFLGTVTGNGMVEIMPGSNVLLGINANQSPALLTNVETNTIDVGATLTTSTANQIGGPEIASLVVNGTFNLGGFDQSVFNLSGSGLIYNLTTQSNPLATLFVSGSTGGSFTTFSGTIEDVPPGSANPGILKLNLDTTSALFPAILTLAPAGSQSNTYSGGTFVGNATLSGTTRGLQGSIDGGGTRSNVVLDQSLGSSPIGAFFGTVSGSAAFSIASGDIELPPGSALSNTRETSVGAGATLQTGAANQLSANSDLSVDGTLDLDGNDQTIASLTGNGIVSTSQRASSGTTTLTVGGPSSSGTFRGIIENSLRGSPSPAGTVAVQKINQGTQYLTGNNTYSGGTTVTGGVLGTLSSPSDPLGSGPVILNGATLQLGGATSSPVQQPIPVTGFNQDVIVEASATDPVAATTVEFDGRPQNPPPLFDWYEQGFGGVAAAGTGLPPGGSIAQSMSNPAVSFQMPQYNQNNVLLLNTVGSSGSLRLVQPAHFATLNLLASGAWRGANVSVALDFADGSTTTYSIVVPDWLSDAPAAINGGGRVLRQTGATVTTFGDRPRMYEFDYTLQPADEARVLNQVTFTVMQGNILVGNIVGIFALSGQSVQIQPQQSYPNPLFVTGNSTLDIRNSPSAFMGALTITNGTLSITGDAGATAQFSSETVNGGNLSLAPAAGTSVTLRNISAPASSLVVSGSGAVLLAGSNSYASTVVNSGTLEAFGASALPSDTPLNVGSAGHVALISSGDPFSVTLSSLQLSGTMDVNTNGVQIAYRSSDPAAVIGSMIASGHLYSSRSDADHAVGYLDTASALTPAIGPNAIQVKYTLLGDTNLDGSVTLADLLNLTRHFGQNAGWSGGDFNYNGRVDLSDFLALTRHFGQSMPVALAASPAVAQALAAGVLNEPVLRRRV